MIMVMRGAAILTLLGGVALLTLGLMSAYGSDADELEDPNEFDSVPTATSTPANTPTPPPTQASPTEAPSPTPTPTPFDGEVASFRIGRFNIDAPVENIGLTPQNQLDVPAGAANVGWYGIYDKPGWGGNALFSAHVSVFAHGPGPFYDLARTNAGDQFVVVMEDGTEYRYEAVRLTRYHVNDIPMGELIEAADRPDGEEWITLITCGGERSQRADGRVDFLHRDVVVARLVETVSPVGSAGATQ
jgi:hypothetical protein